MVDLSAKWGAVVGNVIAAGLMVGAFLVALGLVGAALRFALWGWGIW